MDNPTGVTTQGSLDMIFMQNLRFPSCPRANEPAGCHQGMLENSIDNDNLAHFCKREIWW